MSEAIDFKPDVGAEGEVEHSTPEMFARHLVEWAIDRHASDLFVSDTENSVIVSVRRLGRIEVVRRLARDYGHRLQGYFRVLVGADAGENIRPSEGRASIQTPNGGTVDLRLSALPTLFGQDVAIRLFDPVNGARALDELGLDHHELAAIESLIDRDAGLILVAGPVASGKSSSLYAMIDRLADGSRKIHTLEDPIEHSVADVMQSQVNLRAGLDFADLLTIVLRHSPDVIMIGEIRDEQTAATAVRAGSSGQLVLATIHAKSSAEAIESMLHYGSNPKFLSSALIGVITQRLVRRLCPKCRQVVQLDSPVPIPQHIAYRLEGCEAAVYQPGRCEACFEDGFCDLTCVPEIMDVNDNLADAIANGISSSDLVAMARHHGMLTLADTALVRTLQGITTPQEANRIAMSAELAELVLMAK